MMETKHLDRPWNVFLPSQILNEPSGYLIGTAYRHSSVLCVEGIMSSEGKPHSKNLNIVGYWQLAKADRPRNLEDLTQLSSCMCIINHGGSSNRVCCSLEIRSTSGCMTAHPVVCIFFNPYELGSSFILPHCIQSKNSTTNNDHKNKNAKFVNPECAISILARNVQDFRTKVGKVSGVKSLYRSTSSHWVPGLPIGLLLSVPLILIWIVCQVGHLLNLGLKYFHTCCFRFPKLVQTPSIVEHLQERAASCRSVLLMDRKDRFNMFLLYNCCTQQFVNVCVGLAGVTLFLHYGLANQISSYTLDWADDIASELITLIQWLMGSPAGLKLNAQLTKFLGHFFIYHIHLWTGYLSLLRNVMPSVICACSFMSVLGVTAQMCLVADVLSMLTLHIYCFYVYAAKIFNLQVYVMGSLWRLFRGKKWNVLRSRVDSASYNIDELFFGTLLFTILLFLLPTTALYYAVFATLRVLVLTVQGLISRAVALVISIPVFTLALRLVAPKLVAGSVVFKVDCVPEDENCLILNMMTCQIPISQLIKLTKAVPQPAIHTWGQFISNLATGKLIYPWIEKVRVVKNKMN